MTAPTASPPSTSLVRSSSASRLRITLIGLMAFGLLARIIAYLQNASLSGDEAMLALNVGRRSFTELLHPLDYGQVAPVPFLLAERVATELLGVGGYALRLIPLVSGIVLLPLVYRLARLFVDRLEAVVAVALAATAFPLIRFSVEVKPYMLDSLVAAALVLAAARTLREADLRRRWVELGLAGSAGVLMSAPALLVCTAMGAALALHGLKTRDRGVVLQALTLGTIWVALFAAAYAAWYAPNAGAPYMRDFWVGAFLSPGSANLVPRVRLALADTACTLTCWRGIFDLSPLLLLLGAIGAAEIGRRRAVDAVLVVGPLAAAFGASALGRYPIATRLVLFAAPAVAVLVATGIVAVARRVEGWWPRLRMRWVLLPFLYPSLVLAAALTFLPPADWGVRGVEVRPLAEDFRRRAGKEPVYVFARAVPAWVFHTTDWSSPDTTRLRWVAAVAGPEGLGFVNGPSRGPRSEGEGGELAYGYGDRTELYGTTTGAQGRVAMGFTPPSPDRGWAESEAARIRDVASPYAWMVFTDFAHGPLDERAILMRAVQRAGGQVEYTNASADAVLYRIRFRAGQGH